MVRLSELLPVIRKLDPDCRAYNLDTCCLDEIMIDSVYSDSRRVKENSLFCCIKGDQYDGHDFLADAEGKGAVSSICEHYVDSDRPLIVTGSVRKIMGEIASFVYNDPSQDLLMIAVTGTNGKSTTTYMLRNLLEHAGRKTGLIGTITYHDGAKEEKADRTTPEAAEIQTLLSKMRDNGCSACILEASSHGLQLGRLKGCRFDIGIFTNLTAEHLDFHGDIENYFEAKKSLFDSYMKEKWKMIVNIDDSYGRRLSDIFSDNAITYSLSKQEADSFCRNLEIMPGGCFMDMVLPGLVLIKNVKIPLTGRYNVYNALAAASAAAVCGHSPEEILKALNSTPRVPGRLERYLFDNGVYAVVDYAHTPDALENVLKTLKEVKSGSLRIVFGHGGNRYSQHRQVLGNIAANYADYIYITMDNPRDEDPSLIAGQIREGVEQVNDRIPCRIIIDRKKAVLEALESSSSGDIVLVSGKGPEYFIIWAGKKIPYNDTETILGWAKGKGTGWK